jgi:two-component system sensor histidine kinase QseC
MSLQRRLLLVLLLCAPLAWGAALLVSAQRARHEVNELFDTSMVRLAQQVQAALQAPGALATPPPPGAPAGEADLDDAAIAVWDERGALRMVDHEGAQLPYRPGAAGFVELQIEGDRWQVYYLPSPGGDLLVAAGQRMYERDEVVRDLVFSHLVPWLLVLPLLLAALAWGVRRALAPVHGLTAELRARGADDLQPVPVERAPRELQPLLAAMNGLFARVDAMRARERRFTADAAHELRTPLAVLRAQWDVLRRAGDDAERHQAQERLGAGLERMDRLVTQMLALSRLEAAERLPRAAAVDWTPLVEQAMSDVLALAERRRIELACHWPSEGTPAFLLQGDADLLAVLLRNLLDNAVRYAPPGSTVLLRFGADGLCVENDGPPLPAELLSHLGERFMRGEGLAEGGSGLGVSIARRVAAMHGLTLEYGTRTDGQGVVARVGRA